MRRAMANFIGKAGLRPTPANEPRFRDVGVKQSIRSSFHPRQ